MSNYLSKWICFLYHYLTEIDWMPTFSQVEATLPHNSKEKHPNTLQSLMQVNSFLKHQVIHNFSRPLRVTTYKYHNTAKLLITCIPNGAISYISSLYFGSICDVELICTCMLGLMPKIAKE